MKITNEVSIRFYTKYLNLAPVEMAGKKSREGSVFVLCFFFFLCLFLEKLLIRAWGYNSAVQYMLCVHKTLISKLTIFNLIQCILPVEHFNTDVFGLF